jgi:hypothetical protein
MANVFLRGGNEAPRLMGQRSNAEGQVEPMLLTIPPVDAMRLFADVWAIRNGINSKTSQKAKHIAGSDMSLEGMFNYFQRGGSLSESDLPKIITEIIGPIEPQVIAPRHRKIAKYIKAPDFKENTVLCTIESLHSKIYPEGAVPEFSVPHVDSMPSKIEAHKIRVPIPRNVFLNGLINLESIKQQMLNEGLRDEAQSTYEVLESNPLLGDGLPLFGAANTASVSGNFAEIDRALALFRSQKLPNGRFTELEPKYYVCPPIDEIAVRKELKQAGLNVEVIATANVTKAYLLADPEITPVLLRIALSDMPTIETRSKFSFEGAVLDLLHDFQILAVNRYGVIMLT